MSSHPSLLTEPDLHALAVATQAGMSGPSSPEGEREWGNLRELTKDWIVQQKPGIAPGPLQTRDFEHLAALISPVLSDGSAPLAVSEPAVSQQKPPEADIQPQPEEVERWTREAPELEFAREHLERCL
ncbi:hypothetical protein [Gluconobacter aidae]|uniref:Uncharacterized protein n=1 Tax=Gluconobacter aidae TaxID=2662454 RepID=A0A7X1VNY4_9PROT|nr:hypothetical protein [Gluconobacter aidae]MQR99131.1 hypothetical protein [Gluconobacter aidae]